MGRGDARFPAVVLSTAPVMFGRVVGVYIATLFMISQFIRFAAFRTLRLAGRRSRDRGGGLTVTFWRTGSSLTHPFSSDSLPKYSSDWGWSPPQPPSS